MPKAPGHTLEALLDRSMDVFWKHGFGGVSVGDLVRETGVSRYGIYGPFKGKSELFLACLQTYQERVVSPAFAPVEGPGAGLAEIRDYFETQIARAEADGFPGRGCLVAKTMTERAAHDHIVRNAVTAHNERLVAGFANALRGAAPDSSEAERQALASFLSISAQGLWAHAASVGSAEPLRDYVNTLMKLVEGRLTT